ncbi:YwqG family protein [Nocardioides sp. NPDC127514]|uniref:YwqG family protein n=1 Tax=unclassified Nocardioides TaxID=2615069 RepID=UPI0033236324
MNDAPIAPLAREPGESDRSLLERLAATYLPDDVSRRWLALARPAVRLVPAGPDDSAIARLGGLARVPEDFEWPHWPDHGALSYLAEIDLAALHRSGLELDIKLPTYGRLLVFYFDGSLDGGVELVMASAGTLEGMRLIHLDAAPETCAQRPLPQGHYSYPEQTLTGTAATTCPGPDHPAVLQEFDAIGLPYDTWRRHPLNGDGFTDALWDMSDVGHQIGGWAFPIQGPVELEVLTGPDGQEPAREVSEALGWSLLLQLDSDNTSEMMWGDAGALYWMTRTDTTSTEALGEISFTWQCG